MTDFGVHVDKVMGTQSAGWRVKTTYGQKRDGTRFAFVVTTVWWYAVRLIFEGSYAVERKEFDNMDEVDEYIARKTRELEA